MRTQAHINQCMPRSIDCIINFTAGRPDRTSGLSKSVHSFIPTGEGRRLVDRFNQGAQQQQQQQQQRQHSSSATHRLQVVLVLLAGRQEQRSIYSTPGRCGGGFLSIEIASWYVLSCVFLCV